MIDSKDSIDAKWSVISTNIQEHVTPQQYKTWFKSMRLKSWSDHVYTFTVTNDFLRTWISNYYMEILQESIRKSMADGEEAEIVLETEPPAKASINDRKPEIPDKDSSRPLPSVESREAPPRSQPAGAQKSREFPANQKYRFENFIVGPCNQLSYAASQAVADNPSGAYNPLFLHASSGLGKTHLLQAICHKLMTQGPSVKILSLSCETFINHFISSVEKGDLNNFRFKYRHIDVLVIDDIHLLARKERTQEEFFHTFNSLYNAGKQLVLSSDSPPSDIPTLEERLVSRFKWGLVSPMYPPDFETRCAILKSKSRKKGVELPDEVVTFLAENIQTNIRELEGAITKVLGYATLMNRKLDLDMAQEAMRDVIKKANRFITIDHIVNIITRKYNVKLSDLQSKKRNQSISTPRQVAMYAVKNLTAHSLQEIGAYFGNRDHTTVLHAYSKIGGKVRSDKRFKELMDELFVEIKKNA